MMFLKIYQKNLLVKSELRLNGGKVDLKNINMPLLSLVAQYDHLVPPESSMSFNGLVPSRDKEMFVFPTGHIGMSVSSATHAKMWPRVADWLRDRSEIEEPKTKSTKRKRKKKRKR